MAWLTEHICDRCRRNIDAGPVHHLYDRGLLAALYNGPRLHLELCEPCFRAFLAWFQAEGAAMPETYAVYGSDLVPDP